MIKKTISALAVACTLFAATERRPVETPALPANWNAVLERISPDSLRGHLSFIASDLLEGRNTPSTGLDIAAEYIAAQFRRAGLEPIGKDGYFQAATVNVAGKPVAVRNVGAILRGSDPKLRETYVVLSAHYDHLGVLPAGDGDRVYNGANDDGSGTVSVMEIAAALASVHVKPRRSILFLAFFGEEEGFLGSKHFIEHPVVPLDSIIAQLNLEQVGRTDDLAGPQVKSVGVTGFDYSEVGQVLEIAGARTGVHVHGDNRKPDDFFERSDNLPFAEAGIPAHTLGAAFEFPDYHKPSDEWQKIDYDNMAQIDRMIATAVMLLAENTVAPRWTGSAPKSYRPVANTAGAKSHNTSHPLLNRNAKLRTRATRGG